ncbi:MAG: hypothetical protein AAGA20_11055 [Planctomycetota bacterium]
MNRATAGLGLFLALPSLATPTWAQDETQPQDRPPVVLPPELRPAEPETAAPILASDGQPAAAGRVPDGTPEPARLLWAKVVESLSIKESSVATTAAPRAFELVFDGRARGTTGMNEFRARFAYLDEGPGLVKGVFLDDSGREVSTQMRGLSSDGLREYWYRKVRGESVTEGWIRLVGKDFSGDRAEIDEYAAIAYDVARLTRPNSLRIVELSELGVRGDETAPPGTLAFEGDPGVRLPNVDIEGVRDGRRTSLAELCAGLRWLEVHTPDFRDFRRHEGSTRKKAPTTSIVRLVIGVEETTGRPQVVLVSPQRDGPIEAPGSVLVQCTDWFLHPKDGPASKQSWLPGRFFAYETVEAEFRRVRFSDVAAADLYLVDGTMVAELTRNDFIPR